jgi:fatty-acyl-CoA synthase
VRKHTVEQVQVINPETLEPVPASATSMGEIVIRGNTVMKGYLMDRAATEKAFQGWWFHTGNLAVTHPDGYMAIRDRAKDIVITGGAYQHQPA